MKLLPSAYLFMHFKWWQNMKVVKLASEACSVDDYVAEEFLSNLLYVMCMYVSVCVRERGGTI